MSNLDDDPWAGVEDPFADVPPPTEAPWGERLQLSEDGQTFLAAVAAVATQADQNLDERIRAKLKPGSSILDEPDEVPALWGSGDEVLWAQGEALMIVGPAGVGKTTLTGQLVQARLGLTDEVLGWPVEPGRKRVLYLAMDRPKQIKRSLRRLFSEANRDVLDERLVVWEGPPFEDMAVDTDMLLRMCRDADADTVVVDSLKDAAIKLSEDGVGAGYNRARQAAITAGVEVIELHHQRKNGGGPGSAPNTLADVYGSTWITAGAGSVLCLWGSAGDPIVQMTHLKQPAGEVGPLRIIHDAVRGTTSIHTGTDLLQLVRGFPMGVSARCVAVHLYDTDQPTQPQVEKARRKLDGLVHKGLIRFVPGKRGGPETRWFPDVTGPDDDADDTLGLTP